MTAVVLSYLPVQAFRDNNGLPLVGGQLFTYQGGTTTPAPAYVDSTGTTQLPNPIILNARGEVATSTGASAGLWIPPNTAYKFVLEDIFGNTIWTIDQVFAPVSVLYPITSAEVTAGITPTNYSYPQGDIRRYGADVNGLVDSAAAINTATSLGGRVYIPGLSTFLILSRINISIANTFFFGDGPSSVITTTQTNISHINVTANGYVFKDFKLTCSAVGTTANIAGILVNSASQGRIERVEFSALNWAAVWIHGASNNNIVTKCYMHGWNSQIQDSAGIYVDNGPAENIIVDNDIYGNAAVIGGVPANGGTGMQHGIIMIDPAGNNNPPIKNIVKGNRLGLTGNSFSSYGVAVYMANAVVPDTYNTISENQIEGCLGVGAGANPNTSSGNGIYVVGAGSGATKIRGNTCRNCCINTQNTTLAPAGIGINGSTTGQVPMEVAGNTIEGMTQYYGVLFTGCGAGAICNNNIIRHPAANTTGESIRIQNSSGIHVNENDILDLNVTTNKAVIVFFSTLAGGVNNCTCNGNLLNGGHYAQIRTVRTAGTISNLTIQGNICFGGDSTCIPLRLETSSAASVNVGGNQLSATTVTAITQQACTNVTYTNNQVSSTGTTIISFLSTNTGSRYDASNIGSGIGAGVNNAGTALIIEQLGSAVPAAGTWAVGDMIRNNAPVAAGVFMWICTTAGTGGGTAVFKTISNT